MEVTAGQARKRYELLATTRQPYLDRARLCAEYTIPTLVPPEGASGSTQYPTPYQAMGARGVNTLAAKLLLALFPPNSPFFKYVIDDFMLEKLTKSEGLRAEVEKALGSMERAIQTNIETSNIRTSLFEALKQLVAAGNVLLHVVPDGGMRVYRMDSYVMKRSPSGQPLEIIVKECISPLEVEDSILAAIAASTPEKDTKDDVKKKGPDDTLDLFTYIRRDGKMFKVWQEIEGVKVEGSEGEYPIDKSPWMALRFISVDGQDWGRSYVEEYLGDLISLDGLMKAIVEGSAAMAKLIILVNPNGTTTVKTITDSPNGAVREGRREDVGVVQMEKFGDFRVALETSAKLSEALAYAFLMNTAVQRNAERVTAEEIRFMAGELESVLGGVYSSMSQELQLPLVTRIALNMERKGHLPVLPKGTVRPQVTTGLHALGRGNDLSNLSGLIRDLKELGPEALAYLNVGDLISRAATARQIDAKGLVKTSEEIAQERQQAQMMQMAQSAAPQAVAQIGGAIRDQAAGAAG